MAVYSKYLMQQTKMIWILPLQFFVLEHMLIRRKKIGVIGYVHAVEWGQRDRMAIESAIYVHVEGQQASSKTLLDVV